MKLLILSCNTGEGHNAAARAIQESALRAGHHAEMVDYLNFFNEKINQFTCDTYVGVVRHAPGAFGAFYRFITALSRMFPKRSRSALYYSSSIAAKKLWSYLEENPADAIICTHMFAGEAVAWLRNHDYAVPFSVIVATDYTCYPFWRESSCDYYIVPHENIVERCVARGIPEEKLLPYGIPVSDRFHNLPDQPTAKQMLQLPENVPLYLIMGGSMGAGKLKTFTKKLLPKIGNGLMIVICGKNEQLKATLEKQFAGKQNVQILGFTKEIPTYMAACDCLYTKPGGLTSTEALVSHAPVVHTKPIPGCESDNFCFFGQNGLSIPAKHIRKQIRLGIALAKDHEQRKKMRENQAVFAKPNASKAILELVERNAEVSESAEESVKTGS